MHRLREVEMGKREGRREIYKMREINGKRYNFLYGDKEVRKGTTWNVQEERYGDREARKMGKET